MWTNETRFRYWATTRYIRAFDEMGLLRLLEEDSAYGCETLVFDSVVVSRDKLDSILEIYYLIKVLGIKPFDQLSILDIGAGYGRLAHRFTTVFPRSTYYTLDAVPVSTFICERYLDFRKAARAFVVAFDELDTLMGRRYDFALSVHSFPEQTLASINYWLGLLEELDIPYLFLVDHDGRWRTMESADGGRANYFDLLERYGWRLIDARPKFTSLMGHLTGIYPEAVYALFVRR